MMDYIEAAIVDQELSWLETTGNDFMDEKAHKPREFLVSDGG